jgi:hypothetical protein
VPLLVPSSACDVRLLKSFWHCESGSALPHSSPAHSFRVLTSHGLQSARDLVVFLHFQRLLALKFLSAHRFLWHSTGLVPVLISGFTQGFFGGVGFSLTVLDRTRRKRNHVLCSCSLLMSCAQFCIECFSCRSARLCFACCAQHRTAAAGSACSVLAA